MYLDEAAEARAEVGRRWDALTDEQRREVVVALLDLSAEPGSVHKVAMALNS